MMDEQAAPSAFIRIEHHPDDPCKDDKIISLSATKSDLSELTPPKSGPGISKAYLMPWAPFPTRADFEITQLAVLGLLAADNKGKLLMGVHSNPDDDPLASPSYQAPFVWHQGPSNATIRTVGEMEALLKKARSHTIQVWLNTTYELS
jgi:hypothetical protein